MAGWIDDLLAAARALRRYPGFSLSAILAIGLGIGGVSAVFGLLDAVLLQPLPIAHAERLVAVTRIDSREASIGLPDAVAIRPQLRQFDAFSAVLPDFAIDRVDDEAPERVRTSLVEADYFRAVEVHPILGRVLIATDDVVGAAPVVVLSVRYWRSAFASDPAVVGRVMQLSGVAATIVGVVPDITDVFETGAQMWMPIAPFAAWAPASRGSNNFSAIARVNSASTIADANAELLQISRRLAIEGGNPDKVLGTTPWLQYLTADFRSGLWLLSTAVALVLLLATANVAALFVVRSARRRRELAARQALGANTAHLLRQLLSEGLCLGLAGGVLGLTLAWLGFDALRALAAESLPRLAEAELSMAVVAVALISTLISVCLFSLAPALQWPKPGAAGLRDQRATGSGSERRALALLVTVEVTLATALLGSAALLTRSYTQLMDVPLGIQTTAVIAGEVVLPEAGYAKLDKQSRSFAAMVEALGQNPSVVAAGMVVGPPLSAGQSISHSLLVEGVQFTQADDAQARYRPFVGDYFSAVSLPILAGRAPTSADEHAGVRTAWVNRSFARRYLSGRDPIGSRVAWQPGEASDAETPQWMTVMGVVDDVRSSDLRDADPPVVYAPYLQREANWIRFGTLIAKMKSKASDGRGALTAAVAAGDAQIPLGELAWLSERADRALASDRFNLQMVGSFALIALLLGLQGLFSVVAFAVEQRRAEMGLRMALGANPRDAVWTLMRDGLARCAIGAVLGAALTIALSRWLSSVLYGVSPHDPLTLTAAVIMVLAASFVAVLLPALRTLRIDPKVAMRAE